MDTHDTRARLARDRRLRVAVRIGITAVVLALVIVGVGALTTGDRTAPDPTDLPRIVAPAGQEDYEAGIAALAAGDTTQAVALLKKSAAAGNAASRAKLDEIAKSASTKPSGTPTVTADVYGSRIADLSTLLPESVAGYTAQQIETSTISAILPLQPDRSGPVSRVSLVAVAVLDKGTVSSAKAYAAGSSRSYPKDRQTVKVGTVTASFGTDGSHLASVVFSRGRYAFEVVLTATRGAPANLKDLAIQAASAFPAAR